MPTLEILILPPPEEDGIALCQLVDRPVKLRRVVVNPPLIEPLARIGIQCVVLVKTGAYRRRVVGTPDAERAQPELDPGLL